MDFCGLLDRCFDIVSNFVFLHEQIREMRSIFRKNSYPVEFVDQCINSYLTKKFSPPVSTVKKREVTIFLPYLGRLSLQMVKRLQWTVTKHLKNCNLRVVFKVQRRMRQCFRFKDKIPESLRSYIVYKYTCKICNDFYIGKTDRHYYIRSCEHLGITPIRKQASTRKEIKSAVRDHLLETNHSLCMSGFSIMGGVMSTNDFHLKLKESLYIHKEQPKLNGNESSEHLELFM